jgi:ABC-2 type transport system ATP-binding protein
VSDKRIPVVKEPSADRVGIIRDGRLVALDTVAWLRGQAAHRFEITFLGPIDQAAIATLPEVSDLSFTARPPGSNSPPAPTR